MLIHKVLNHTPASRFVKKYLIMKKMQLGQLLLFSKSRAGRSKSGQLVVFSKQNTRKLAAPLMYADLNHDLNYSLIWKNTKVQTTSLYSVLRDSTGRIRLVPAVYGAYVGSYFNFSSFNSVLSKTPLYLGMLYPLLLLPYQKQISNLSNSNYFTNGFAYARAAGTFAIKIKESKRDKLLKVQLPSDNFRFFKKSTLCLLGRNAFADKKKLVVGKAGFAAKGGRKPCVRGVAMNPVDHPNGGRTKSCSPEKTPWGKIAKLNK